MLLPLNGFLLRPGVTPLTAVKSLEKYERSLSYWYGGQLAELDGPEDDLFHAAVEGDTVVLHYRRPRALPAWQVFFREAMGVQEHDTVPTSAGAVVFCAIEDERDRQAHARWVAWCFGTGSRLLQRSASDPRFGLMVAMNLLATPDDADGEEGSSTRPTARTPQLREMRYRTTAPFFQQTGHRAARDIPVNGFRIDRTSDLLAAIGGRTVSAAFTRSVLGGRSLRFRSEVTVAEDLARLSVEVRDLARLPRYKDVFPWVDHITLVEDDSVVAELRRQLAAHLLTGPPVPNSVDAILPDDLLDPDDERAICHALFPGERMKSRSRTNLTIDGLALFLSRRFENARPDEVLDAELRFLDDAGDKVGTASVLECVCAELTLGGERFVAYDGDFYRVDETFVQRIDQELASLPFSSLDFPAYRAETEPDYITRVGTERPDEYVVMDRALIRIEGESGVESSDLIARSGALVHVKRKGKSSTLSHLFFQAANSCELLRRSPAAQLRLSELVASRSMSAVLTDEIRAAHLSKLPSGLEVTMAFLGDWRNRSIVNLPFFSRISLVQESRRIGHLGYQPTIALISS